MIVFVLFSLPKVILLIIIFCWISHVRWSIAFETRVSNQRTVWLPSLGGGADLCVHRKLLRPSLFVVSPQTMVMSVVNWSSFVPPSFVTRGFFSISPQVRWDCVRW
jgi:hypothetical protein